MQLEIGKVYEFAKDLDGVCAIRKGDQLRYLGNSQARILTGESCDWLVSLTLNAPIREHEGN